MLIAPLLALAIGWPNHASAPAWLDFMLAGYGLTYDEHHGPIVVHDRASGFYLTRGVVCDGGDLYMRLTRDRKEMRDNGDPVDYRSGVEAGVQYVEKTLPNLRTGKGIGIGDSPAKMIALLGKPSDIEISGSVGQYTEYHYVTKQRSDVTFEETYTFRGAKLVEIYFDRNSGL
jgi:hypothetical protein